MRISSVEAEPIRRTKRKNIFLHILEALHASRRREAIHVLRRYRYLMAPESRVGTATIAAPPQQSEDSLDANGNTTPVRADRRMREGARNQFA